MVKKTDVDKQIDVVEGKMSKEEAEKPEYERVYQVYENTRIPVSKSMGPLWRIRYREARQLVKSRGMSDRWKEAIRYYQNDQGARSGKTLRMGETATGKSTEPLYSTENVVFANVSALVPATYAKNPKVEITHTKQGNEPRAQLFERLLDTLFRRKVAPGINLKPRMRRLVVTTMLTNIAYLDLSYIVKEDSSEQAVAEIEKLSEELSKAKDNKKIQEIEGQLSAIDERISLLSPSGPKLSYRDPTMVFVDPESTEPDFTDAKYIMVGSYMRTEYIRAMYGRRNENDEWLSIYKPTHVLSGDTDSQGHDDEVNNFSLLTDEDESEHTKYGYADEQEFKNNCRTLTWTVWDKTTRRMYLFNDTDWSWPIWVWDDPYKLSRFYPVFPLSFYTDPKDMYARSEVMYYLDQQDEINRITNERARMRHWAMSKVFINSNIVKDPKDVKRFLDPQTDDYVFGIDLPEGSRIEDVLGCMPAPSTKFEGLFDTAPMYEAINRMSSVTPILRGVEFKTNTTNKAIETYESSTQMRLDEKIDAIEDILGDVAGALLEMCVQFMDEQTVIDLLGAEFVERHGGWQNMTVQQLHTEYNLQITGGSTLKPTSRVKKDQAMQLGQILGQFANASPMLVIVMMKMIERAFSDDVVITPEEWEIITQGTAQQMQRGSPDQGGQQQQQPQGQPQPQEQAAQQQQGGGEIEQVMSTVEQIIQRLPDEARAMLGQGIARGIPLKQLVSSLTQQASQQGAPQ